MNEISCFEKVKEVSFDFDNNFSIEEEINEGISREEICNLTGMNRNTVQRSIKRAISCNKAKFIGYRKGVNVLGGVNKIPLYTFLV